LILNILTAFIRLGRAGPAGAGCPPDYYYYLAFPYIIFVPITAPSVGAIQANFNGSKEFVLWLGSV
jgi:hypothetical protein